MNQVECIFWYSLYDIRIRILDKHFVLFVYFVEPNDFFYRFRLFLKKDNPCVSVTFTLPW